MSDEELPLNDEMDDGPEAEQPTVDAANPEGHRTKKQRIAVEHRESVEFWQGIFATKVGRREMWRLLESCHTFEERFACGPNGFPQPEATWFHAGEQSFGQRIYQMWLRLNMVGVVEMHKEHDSKFVVPTVPRNPKVT